MIKFKTLKYKHQKQAQEINRRIDNEEIDEDEILRFVVSLVETWDLVDSEIGQALNPQDADCIYELSLEQYKELMIHFNRRMGVEQEIPKANGGQSPSGSTNSNQPKKTRQRKSRRSRQGGSTTLR